MMIASFPDAPKSMQTRKSDGEPPAFKVHVHTFIVPAGHPPVPQMYIRTSSWARKRVEKEDRTGEIALQFRRPKEKVLRFKRTRVRQCICRIKLLRRRGQMSYEK